MTRASDHGHGVAEDALRALGIAPASVRSIDYLYGLPWTARRIDLGAGTLVAFYTSTDPDELRDARRLRGAELALCAASIRVAEVTVAAAAPVVVVVADDVGLCAVFNGSLFVPTDLAGAVALDLARAARKVAP
jgi:hypothetical protein